MIGAGDCILVAVSGGTDSLVLLWMLRQRQRWSPVPYTLAPVYIDPGFPGDRGQRAAAFCESLGLPLKVVHTDDGVRAHSPENLENPCFFCARRRRRRLFEIAGSDGCRKIALGHNQDDIIETFFINVCYAGEISTMVPAQSFFDQRFVIIRPLAYAAATKVRRLAREIDLPRIENPCPSAENSRRRQVRDVLAGLYRTNRKIRGNIFNALHNVKHEYLLKP
jgi:tRNA 2-thiocytidine biosynthesis protein TtcA